MPKRKIPMNNRSLTGRLAGGRDPHEFESALERDFLTLMEFDLNVSRCKAQPVEIPWTDDQDQARIYVPDVLVMYRKDIEPAKSMKTMLVEVKGRDDLRENWATYQPKFKAALRYATKRDWAFKIFTEREIRSDYLNNARFLLSYVKDGYEDAYVTLLMNRIAELRETDPQTLIRSIFWDEWNQAALIPTMWHLVGIRQIGTDLSRRLTMKSRIWTTEIY